MKLAIHFHLGMLVAIPPLPLYVFVEWYLAKHSDYFNLLVTPQDVFRTVSVS